MESAQHGAHHAVLRFREAREAENHTPPNKHVRRRVRRARLAQEQSSAQKSRRAAESDSESSAPPSEPGEGVEDVDAETAVKNVKVKDAKEKAAAAKSKRAPPSARLPLTLAPKVRKDMLLAEVTDPHLDLSGDFGCIGKLHVKKTGKDGAGSSSAAADEEGGRVAELRQTLMLDLKGKVYDADILPSNTLCLMTVDGSKAKIDAVFSDYCQLAPPRDSIFDMQEVAGGQFDADFFDDGEVLSNMGDDSEEEQLGPLKEHKDGAGKKKGKAKAKPAAKKGKGKDGGAGGKRKAGGAAGGGGKKAKK